jgi:hypothetical protein
MLISVTISLIGLFLLFINSVLFFSSRKNKDIVYRYIMYYLMIQFAVELCCNIIGILYPNENFFLSHYYFVIQFIMLSLFFFQLFKNKLLKNLVYINLGIVLLILAFQYYKTPSLYWKFNNFEIGTTSILLILYSIVYFYENLKESYKYHFFCSGLTFYLMSSCLIFLTGNTQLVFMTKPFYLDIWIFNSLFFILFQILIYKEWQFLVKKEKKIETY